MSDGTWRRLTVDPPLQLLAGDQIVRVSKTLVRQMRGSTIVAERTLVLPGSEEIPGPVAAPVSVADLFYYEEKRMPGIVATMTNVTETPAGAVNFAFPDGGLQFSTWEDIPNQINLDTDPDFAKKIAILKAFRNSPDGTNKTTMVGGSVSVDFNGDTPIVLTPPLG